MVDVDTFGRLKDGREAKLFTLTNKNGVIAKISNYGALLTHLFVPDREGNVKDLVHGFDHLKDWEDNDPYFGATVGRFGNRIAGGTFTLDGETYSLPKNNDPAGIPCHLHGGLEGFNHKLWDATVGPDGVALSYLSKDGEEGYPGDLMVTVIYTLNEDNELTWKARATTTKATPVNIIHHSYWNLSGDPTTSINNHLLTLNAEHYLPITDGMIPTGESRPSLALPWTSGQRPKLDFGLRKTTPTLRKGMATTTLG